MPPAFDCCCCYCSPRDAEGRGSANWPGAVVRSGAWELGVARRSGAWVPDAEQRWAGGKASSDSRSGVAAGRNAAAGRSVEGRNAAAAGRNAAAAGRNVAAAGRNVAGGGSRCCRRSGCSCSALEWEEGREAPAGASPQIRGIERGLFSSSEEGGIRSDHLGFIVLDDMGPPVFNYFLTFASCLDRTAPGGHKISPRKRGVDSLMRPC